MITPNLPLKFENTCTLPVPSSHRKNNAPQKRHSTWWICNMPRTLPLTSLRPTTLPTMNHPPRMKAPRTIRICVTSGIYCLQYQCWWQCWLCPMSVAILSHSMQYTTCTLHLICVPYSAVVCPTPLKIETKTTPGTGWRQLQPKSNVYINSCTHPISTNSSF